MAKYSEQSVVNRCKGVVTQGKQIRSSHAICMYLVLSSPKTDAVMVTPWLQAQERFWRVVSKQSYCKSPISRYYDNIVRAQSWLLWGDTFHINSNSISYALPKGKLLVNSSKQDTPQFWLIVAATLNLNSGIYLSIPDSFFLIKMDIWFEQTWIFTGAGITDVAQQLRTYVR